MIESTRLLCAVCSDPVDPDTAHWPHEPDCGKAHGITPDDARCGCDRATHPECCPELECQDIGNGHTIELTARFSVPPWFTADQAHALASRIKQYITWTDWPFHADYGPSPAVWYGYDAAYTCAVQAESTVIDDGEALAAKLMVWGHGDRCRSCHHVDSDHAKDNTGRCAVPGCDCLQWLPYGRLPDIGEAQQ